MAGVSLLASYAARGHMGDIPAGAHVMLDSGAFSAYHQGVVITVGELAEWYRSLPGHERYAALDVIHQPEQSRANALAMQAAGLDVMPVVHAGTNPAEVDRLADDGFTSVALGGMVSSTHRRGALFRWAHACLDRAERRELPVHGFGFCPSRPQDHGLLLRFASVDMTAWLGMSKYGQVAIWNGSRMRAFYLNKDRLAIVTALRSWPHLDLTTVAKRQTGDTDGTSWLWYVIGAVSYLLYGDWLMAHGGPRVYLAGYLNLGADGKIPAAASRIYEALVNEGVPA